MLTKVELRGLLWVELRSKGPTHAPESFLIENFMDEELSGTVLENWDPTAVLRSGVSSIDRLMVDGPLVS